VLKSASAERHASVQASERSSRHEVKKNIDYQISSFHLSKWVCWAVAGRSQGTMPVRYTLYTVTDTYLPCGRNWSSGTSPHRPPDHIASFSEPIYCIISGRARILRGLVRCHQTRIIRRASDGARHRRFRDGNLFRP
jgi:hypothetical protein